ncbi:hypothetical protein, partial [Stenotrophomonas indicatrix]|uniref:hypothetical protein n=1 Tax=Stenotrophomonas indicatrix TaxID=2045451 RepID=UPI00373545E1
HQRRRGADRGGGDGGLSVSGWLLRHARPPRRAALAALTLAWLLPGAAGAACMRLNPGDQDVTVSMTMPNLDLPDRRFVLQSGATLIDPFQCDPGTNAFVVDLPLTGLTYEREIASDDGRTYSVYSLGPRSP